MNRDSDRDTLPSSRTGSEAWAQPNGRPLPCIAMVSTHGYVSPAPPLGAADTGGQVVYVLELSKKLAQLGYQVDIWTRQFEGQPLSEAVNERVRIVRVPCSGPSFIAKEYLHESLSEWSENALRKLEQQALSYDFVNSHYWDGGIAGRYLAAALRVPHLHTPHSLGAWKQRQMRTDYPDDAAQFERTYNFGERIRSEREIYHDADLVIATTPDQTDVLREAYEVPAEKLRMIPPGYDDTRFFPVGQSTRSLLRQRLGFDGKVVLALGRIATNKGYDLLIQGFADVARRIPEARLHLAIGGDRSEPAEVQILERCRETARALNLESRVRFAGYVPDDELPDLYRAADVFVLSSRYEPFGMTAVEAMACGTPTVVTTHGGLFRVLRFGINGLFADPFDSSDLGITMLKPLQYPRLSERLSRYGAQTARLLFTWTGIAQQLLGAAEGHQTAGVALNEFEPASHWISSDDY